MAALGGAGASVAFGQHALHVLGHRLAHGARRAAPPSLSHGQSSLSVQMPNPLAPMHGGGGSGGGIGGDDGGSGQPGSGDGSGSKMHEPSSIFALRVEVDRRLVDAALRRVRRRFAAPAATAPSWQQPEQSHASASPPNT